MMTYAKRTAHLKPEGAYQVLARAQDLEAEGLDIIHLEIGQPDFETFPNVCQAGIRASHLALSLARAGWLDVRVYDGSFKDYSRRSDLPLQKT